MSNLTNINKAIEIIIDDKLEDYGLVVNNKISELETKIVNSSTHPKHEILQQKEVFEILGIGRRKLKKWVDEGLKEIRVDNRVYYKFSDVMEFIETRG